MTKRNATNWGKAIEFWGNGGNLWYWDANFEKWEKYEYDAEIEFSSNRELFYIMEDKHFEARKADALGEKVEFINNEGRWMDCNDNPEFRANGKYRPKKREWYDYASPENPILCWTFNCDYIRVPVEIVGYEKGSMNPFITVNGRYDASTRPVTPNECFQG